MRLYCKIWRILTLPPLVTGLMLVLLRTPGGLLDSRDMLIGLGWLFLLPMLAYPVSALKKGGDPRARQRSVAMTFSAVGYVCGLLHSFLGGCSTLLRVIFLSYTLSIIVLLLCNKVLRFRASGHACSSTAPLIFLGWLLHPLAALPCVFLVAGVYSSSIRLGRHTLAQLLTGSAISTAAWCVSRAVLNAA